MPGGRTRPALRAITVAAVLACLGVQIVLRPKLFFGFGEQQYEADEAGCSSLALSDEAAGTFTASVCWDSGACKGVLKISRRRCKGSGWLRNLSHDPEHDRWIRSHEGPDTWRVRITGPEVFLAPVRYLGGCDYEAAVEVWRGGEYVVAAELLHQDYDSLDEVRNVWPALQKTPLLRLGRRAEAAQRTMYHLGQLTLPSEVTLTCAADRQRASTSTGCSAAASGVGRWVREDGVVMTKVRVKKVQRQPVSFQYSLQPERAHRWEPESRCAMPELEKQYMQRCLAGKRVVVGGDSQLRAFYFGLLNVMRGQGVRCVQNISAPDHFGDSLFDGDSRCVENAKGSHKHSVAGTQLDFVEDAYIDKGCKLPSPRYGRYDIAVIGFAQHPASRVHWSLARYRAAVAERVVCVRALLQSGVRVVWLLAPKYPDTKVGYPVGVKDWRTDPRLTLFNAEAARALAPLRVPVMDLFHLTASMGHASSDQAHYNNWILYEEVRMLFSELCSER